MSTKRPTRGLRGPTLRWTLGAKWPTAAPSSGGIATLLAALAGGLALSLGAAVEAGGSGSTGCVGDVNFDGDVGAADLGILIAAWGRAAPGNAADFDQSGVVDGSDLGTLLAHWGPCADGTCPAEGSCYEEHATTGCDDVACCSTVCSTDAFCCWVEWDALCKEIANALCAGCGDPDAGSCCEAHAGVGCSDAICCRAVCEVDAFCCSTGWDALCAEAACGAGGLCAPVDLDVDANRDGDILPDDEVGEEKWTTARGAFFLVNCDDDDEDFAADCAEYDADEDLVLTDAVINAGDEPDITPLVVGAVPNLMGKKVFLRAGSMDQIRAVHVFEQIAEGEAAIWGGPTEMNQEIEITGMVSERDELGLGIEGLKYRLDANGVAGFNADMLFDGHVQFELRSEDGAGKVLSRDSVLLKVAPWIMLPNDQDAEKVFAQDYTRLVPMLMGGVPVLVPKANTQFRTDLASGLPAGMLEIYTSDTQWAQDDLEFGYSQTPHSALRAAAYTRHHGDDEDVVGGLGDALWRRTLLMGPAAVAADVGIYRNPFDPATADSGDYGGNIELLPPTTFHPLGRICTGSTISDKKYQFFVSQQVQEPFFIDTDFLRVGHVDEIVCFQKRSPLTVILASPRLAYQTLGLAAGFPAAPALPAGAPPPGGPTEEVPDDATFFSVGEIGSGEADIPLGGVDPFTTLVDNEANFLSPPIPWKFVRIYDGSASGQIAHIAFVQDSHTLVIDHVWDTEPSMDPLTFDAPTAAGFNSGITYASTSGPLWQRGEFPTAGSKYVVMEDTLWWDAPAEGIAGPIFPAELVPATVTRKELRSLPGTKGEQLKKLNVEIQTRIDAVRAQIEQEANPLHPFITDPVTFVEVPVIFTGSLDAMNMPVPRRSFAWTPGAANIVVANSKLFVAAQKGPRFRKPNGMLTVAFEDVIRNQLGAGNVVFVEDWVHYHIQMGEVHCGTNVLREAYDFEWWDEQPDGVPDLP